MNIKADSFNSEKVSLCEIMSGYKNAISKENFVKVQIILLKMQRDLLAISSTIASDQNLRKDQNNRVIKEQIQILSKHMNKEIEYIKLACQYEDTPQAQKVREKLLACEYSKTKYDNELDYEFWYYDGTYMEKGSAEQLKRLSEIHNSELSIKTSKLYVDSLDYQMIREFNWGRGYLYSHNPQILPKDCSNKALGNAREQFRKDRNDSTRKLFSIFDFTTSLHNILTSGYYPETYSILYKNSYVCEWNNQDFINIEAKEFHKSLKNGPNASCWNKK